MASMQENLVVLTEAINLVSGRAIVIEETVRRYAGASNRRQADADIRRECERLHELVVEMSKIVGEVTLED